MIYIDNALLFRKAAGPEPYRNSNELGNDTVKSLHGCPSLSAMDYYEWHRLKETALDSQGTKTWIAEPPVCRSDLEQVTKGFWASVLLSVNGDDNPHRRALLDTLKG